MRRVRPLVAAMFALCLAAVSHASFGAIDADGRKIHKVYKGQTLGRIAKRYRISVDALCRVNRLRHGAHIRPGQELVIPNGEDDDGAPPSPHGAGNRWQDFSDSPSRRGFIVLESPNRKFRGYVLNRRGKTLEKSRDAIEHVLASWRTGSEHSIDDRLLHLIVKVSDTFGGRPIRVVSGYREHSFAVESKHKVGRAFDFSIPGVPNAVLKDYLRSLSDVGVGYYPNSTHVHLDVREESAYWMDESATGEPPKYAHAGQKSDDDSADPKTQEAEPERAATTRVE